MSVRLLVLQVTLECFQTLRLFRGISLQIKSWKHLLISSVSYNLIWFHLSVWERVFWNFAMISWAKNWVHFQKHLALSSFNARILKNNWPTQDLAQSIAYCAWSMQQSRRLIIRFYGKSSLKLLIYPIRARNFRLASSFIRRKKNFRLDCCQVLQVSHVMRPLCYHKKERYRITQLKSYSI